MEQAVNVLRVSDRLRGADLRFEHEAVTVVPVLDERALVGFQTIFPARRANYYAASDLLHIAHELAPDRPALRKVELVEATHEVASLLKFNGQKERRTDVDAFHFAALRIGTTRFNLVGPEVQPRLIRLAPEKVVIVFADKEARVVNRIKGRRRFIIVVDRYYRRVGRGHGRSACR